jgi:hypothetical protein
MKPKYTWDAEHGIATCTVYYKQHEFSGLARCDDADRDMMNEKTGCFIAEMRAEIKLLKYVINEYTQEAKTLNHFHSIISQSDSYDYGSYESYMLRRQIRLAEGNRQVAKEILENHQQALSQYIKDKDDFYKSVRAFREEKANKS